MQVTKLQLWSFLDVAADPEITYDDFAAEYEKPPLDRETFEALQRCDLRVVLAGSDMSENHLGGDDLVGIADDVLRAIHDGYTITTWYGHDTEALVAGYRPEQLSIQEWPPAEDGDA